MFQLLNTYSITRIEIKVEKRENCEHYGIDTNFLSIWIMRIMWWKHKTKSVYFNDKIKWSKTNVFHLPFRTILVCFKNSANYKNLCWRYDMCVYKTLFSTDKSSQLTPYLTWFYFIVLSSFFLFSVSNLYLASNKIQW